MLPVLQTGRHVRHRQSVTCDKTHLPPRTEHGTLCFTEGVKSAFPVSDQFKRGFCGEELFP